MQITAYEVGGCVRDKFLGLDSKDIDYAVEAPSFAAMEEWVLSEGSKIFLNKPEYNTIRAKHPTLGDVDFVLCRKDGTYSDGRRPDTIEPGDIYDDLARRDFTMNAIAKRIDGSYIDPYNGIDDIGNKIIRCVGSVDRLKEDALRMIRALRFSITKGFKLDPMVMEVMIHEADLLTSVSSERIREEMAKCFKFNTLQTLKRLETFQGLRDHIFGKTGLKLIPSLKK